MFRKILLLSSVKDGLDMGAKKRTRGMERLEGNGNWVKKWLQPEGWGEGEGGRKMG